MMQVTTYIDGHKEKQKSTSALKTYTKKKKKYSCIEL